MPTARNANANKMRHRQKLPKAGIKIRTLGEQPAVNADNGAITDDAEVTTQTNVASSDTRYMPTNDTPVSWVIAEKNSLMKVSALVSKQLKSLSKKISAKRVHKTRVALRHWSALWKILRNDGWESEVINTELNKPLEKLLTELGEIRDADINLELGEQIDVGNRLMDKWRVAREQAMDDLSDSLFNLKIDKLRKKLKKYSRKAAKKVSAAIKKSDISSEDKGAEFHFNANLESQERLVHSLIDNATTPETYHHLRLALKDWRYILEDIFDSQQKDLADAQAKLGELHDCDRLHQLLVVGNKNIAAIAALNQMRQKLLLELNGISSSLPFGLRPTIQLDRE